MVIKGAKDIGAYIGMSVATFHRHKDLDGIPYFRSGRTICAKSEDLSDWIDRQKETAQGRKECEGSDS